MKTKRMFLYAMAISALVFFPMTLYGQDEGGRAPDLIAPNSPAVAPPLVPEGLLAVELAKALNLGQAQNEAEAETLLSAAGIEPKNGWIADYPVTPDILGEIDQSVAAAADARKLNMDKDGALRTVDDTVATLGLNLYDAALPPPQAAGGPYAETPPPNAYSGDQYAAYPAPLPPNPQVINNYYYSYGPPVVTYYPPPEPYGYLYAWVPYPFWCSSVYFPGFFILHDFHRTVPFHHRPFIISNHVVHPGTGTVFRVDPVTRGRWGRGAATPIPPPRHFQTPSAQAGARSIVTQSRQGTQPLSPTMGPRNRSRNGPPRNSDPGNMGAQQQIRSRQPVNPRLAGGANVNRGANPNPGTPGSRVMTGKPIRPSVSERRNEAALPSLSARQARPSARSVQPAARSPENPGSRGTMKERNFARPPSGGARNFTAQAGHESSYSAPPARVLSQPAPQQNRVFTTSGGTESHFFAGPRGASGGFISRGSLKGG